MRAINLKTNHLTAPVGIDAGPLFLSWQCADGVRQTAYEIQLTANGEMLWHSGKTEGAAMHADVPAVGGSRVSGCWRVRLWDENDVPGAWSEARFETGLAQCDWVGEWVDPETEPIDIPGDDAINAFAHPNWERKQAEKEAAGKGAAESYKPHRPASYLRKSFTASKGEARLYITAKGLYAAWLDGKHIGDMVLAPGSFTGNKHLGAQTYDVTALLHEGENELLIALGDGWHRSTGGVDGDRDLFGDTLGVLFQLEVDGKPVCVSDDTMQATQCGPIRQNDMQQGEVYNVLEAGNYKINLCSDSHTILDTYVAKVDKDVIYDDAHDGARSTDQVAATNQLTFAQGDVTYLSRADGFANYAEATAAPANHSLSAQALADYASAATFDAAKYDDPNAVMPTTGANNGLKLADLTGVAYDDPKWEQLLDELTVNDLFSLTADGGYHTVGVESIGLSATEDCDGPTGVHSNYNPAAGPSYPGTVMLACTWNQPLAKARGEQIAKECAEINCTGWYAPAMNIHRSAFGGRNFEYYSECGVLSGLTAAAEVSGATENGLICYVKHFAFNDQDNYRQNNICTWLNEQSAREIYLKAFEQPIKAGGMGVMTSMNAVGPVWAGGCKALLTNILRDEWGFHGAVITDAVVSAWYMDGNLAIRTGGTKMLAFNITNEFYRDLNSVGTVTAMRNAAHGTLYALANSFAVTRAVAVPKWVKTTYAVDAVVAIILVAWEICAIRKYRKAKKEDEDTEQ